MPGRSSRTPVARFLYRVGRLSQGAQSNARGRRAEQRTIANQKQRRAEQIENARYQLKRAAARDDMDAVEHWINRLSILGVKNVEFEIEVGNVRSSRSQYGARAQQRRAVPGRTGITDFSSIPFHRGEQETYTRALEYVESCVGHPERIEDARRAAADLNRVAEAVNERIEQFIRDGVTRDGCWIVMTWCLGPIPMRRFLAGQLLSRSSYPYWSEEVFQYSVILPSLTCMTSTQDLAQVRPFRDTDSVHRTTAWSSLASTSCISVVGSLTSSASAASMAKTWSFPW